MYGTRNSNTYICLRDEGDLGLWDPLEDFDDEVELGGCLDLGELREIAASARRVINDYGLQDLPYVDGRVEGEEVGDDRIDLSTNPMKLALSLVCQERVTHMVTSDEDTAISTCLWNFCEITSMVPVHPKQSFDAARKVGNFDDLGFIDVPPLRIILDVMKGDRSHSSTAAGKATMLGTRARTPRTEFLRDFHLASFLQDGFLRTSRMSEPKYLPKIMGGSGVRALFSNPVNLHLYVKAYKNGRCDRIYGSATRELRQSLDSLVKGERVIMPILNRRLRDKQEYLHGTYAEKIFIPERRWMSSFRESLPEPLIKESGGANLFAAFENRLIRTRHLVTRTSAECEWENTSKIRNKLLSRYNPVSKVNEREAFEKKAARRRFGMALNANTAFAHLLERKGSIQDVLQLITEDFRVVNCGATEFTKWDSEWLFFGGKAEGFSIEDLTSSEDLFLRREVSEEESMKVGSIPLTPVIGRKPKTVVTTTTVGLYQIGTGMYEWAANLTERLVNARDGLNRPLEPVEALTEYQRDPEWVNDDTLIISRCLHDTSGRAQRSTDVILVSADKRLANQLCNSCNVTVNCIHPITYIKYMVGSGREPIKELDPETIRKENPSNPNIARVQHVYVDTGSVNSFLSRIESTDGKTLNIVKSYRPLVPSKLEEKRGIVYEIEKVPCTDTLYGRKYLPVQRPKKFQNRNSFGSETLSRRTKFSKTSDSLDTWRRGM